MNTSIYSLPGVKTIHWVYAGLVPSTLALEALSGVPTVVLTDMHPIEFFGDAEATLKSERKEGSCFETATLKFTTCIPVPQARRTAFVVTTVDGMSYIIGSRLAPYPKVNFTRSAGSPAGGSASTEVEITHTAVKTMVKCRVVPRP